MKNNLIKTINLFNKLDRLVDTTSLPTDERTFLAASSFAFSLDTGRGINILLDNGMNSPAFALARVMFEAYIRGTWFYNCASENQLKKFINTDKLDLKFGEMILEIEKIDELSESKALSRSKKANWKSLCSLTHSGIEQLGRYSNPSELYANYEKEDINSLSVYISNIALLACSEFSKLVKDETISKQLLDIEKGYRATP